MTTEQRIIATQPGQEPAASPGARWIAILTSIALIALGGAAIRELWVRHANTTWPSWANPFTHWVGTLHYQQWMLYAGAAAIIVGLALLVLVFKPRPKTHRRLVDPAGNVWMRNVDIARMTTAAAHKIPGVRDASSEVTASKVLVTINGDTSDATLSNRVARTLGPIVAQVADNPQLLVKITAEKEDRS